MVLFATFQYWGAALWALGFLLWKLVSNKYTWLFAGFVGLVVYALLQVSDVNAAEAAFDAATVSPVRVLNMPSPTRKLTPREARALGLP